MPAETVTSCGTIDRLKGVEVDAVRDEVGDNRIEDLGHLSRLHDHRIDEPCQPSVDLDDNPA